MAQDDRDAEGEITDRISKEHLPVEEFVELFKEIDHQIESKESKYRHAQYGEKVLQDVAWDDSHGLVLSSLDAERP